MKTGKPTSSTTSTATTPTCSRSSPRARPAPSSPSPSCPRPSRVTPFKLRLYTSVVKNANPDPTFNPRFNPRVDAYIAQAAAFAQPVLTHLRALMHKGCPQVEETIKWSRPFFLHRGIILSNMSAFQHHCSFGFWGTEIGAVLREASVLHDDGMGSLGRIVRLQDLPPHKLMLEWIRQAAAFVESGEYTSPIAAR